MEDREEIEVTPGVGPGAYNVFSAFSKDTIGFSAQGLLDLATWVQEHRDELRDLAYNYYDCPDCGQTHPKGTACPNISKA